MTSKEKIKLFFAEADPKIHSILQTAELSRWETEPIPPTQFFYSLVNQIVSQQLSTKVADVISERLQVLVGDRPFTPATLIEIDDDSLRAVGLSRAKTSYIKNLATKILAEEIDLHRLPDLAENEVIMELTKVKGIGKWTAEMFLMFSLGKEDVFSYGDWGLRTALKNVYNLPNYPTESEAVAISNKWRPFRSYGSFALWASLEKKG